MPSGGDGIGEQKENSRCFNPPPFKGKNALKGQPFFFFLVKVGWIPSQGDVNPPGNFAAEIFWDGGCTADPNLPLATAAENISDLLRDAHQDIRSQYARCLAQNIPKTTSIDVLSVDRSQLFQPDSLLRCLLVTQGSILRDATSSYPLFTAFLLLCSLAINDEAQQGGQAGFTIIAALLSRFCLQIFTGDREHVPPF